MEESRLNIIGNLRCDVCNHEIVYTRYVCDDCQRELIKKRKNPFNLQKEIRERVDGHAYAMFILVFAVISYFVAESHGRGIATFIFALETVILELSYRLSLR